MLVDLLTWENIRITLVQMMINNTSHVFVKAHLIGIWDIVIIENQAGVRMLDQMVEIHIIQGQNRINIDPISLENIQTLKPGQEVGP